MLQRFLEQQPAICAALLSGEVRKTEKEVCTLSESDITSAEEIVTALKPMKALPFLSDDKHQDIYVRVIAEAAKCQQRETGVETGETNTDVVPEVVDVQEEEMKKYKEAVPMSLTGANPLGWWKQHQNKYPLVTPRKKIPVYPGHDCLLRESFLYRRGHNHSTEECT
ncbi:hypothetical protein QQF64_035794 [Cirrhinus molitorella]|uniref:HAT C-terminal dimerisation domain-containing protein n=1 Tax=Cirrhinus molitorella TaxID=172907 RepID=A0ABR3NHH2_9TELE